MFIERNTLKKITLYSFMSCIFVFFSGPHVLAVEYDEEFFSGNDITFYDPRVAACSSVNLAVNTTSSDNEETILRFFTSKGLTLAAGAGFIGNMKQESQLNSRIIQGGGGLPIEQAKDDVDIMSLKFPSGQHRGFGLVQWTSPGRKQGLANFAKAQGKPITSIELQLEYVWKELNTSYKSSTLDKVASMSDPIGAAVIIHDNYEISADTTQEVISVRGGEAKNVYDRWKSKIKDGSGVENVSSSLNGDEAAGCANPTSLGQGSGEFTDKGEVEGYDTVLKNAQIVDKAYGDRLVGIGKCATIVARTWQGRVGSAYNYFYAIDAWNANPSMQHKDRSPKKGSILIYDTSNVAEHVVIYLGNNKILNDGKIINADFLENQWKAKYIGWMDPNDGFSGKSKGVGGKWSTPPQQITESNVKSVIGL